MSIASGSSGNCILVGTDCAKFLVDAGISGKRIEEGLLSEGLKPGDLDGIFLTHEHTDHISGLKVMSKRYKLPIYATAGTIDAVLRTPGQKEIPVDLFHEIRPDEVFSYRNLEVVPFRISHDAAEPVAYRFYEAGMETGEQRTSVATATDLGKYDDYIIENLKGAAAVLLEANHDINMLQVGRYPYRLKQRILGDRGHLSNDSAAMLLRELSKMGLKAALLGHLSEENNFPALAYETVRLELKMSEGPGNSSGIALGVADRNRRSAMIRV